MAFTELQEHPHDVTACIHLCSIAVDSQRFSTFFKSWKGQRMDALHFPRISACLGLGSASLSWEAQFSNDLWGVFQTWLLWTLTWSFSVLQVCSDGLLLGFGPRGEAQVSAAGPVSHRVSRSVGCLRVKAVGGTSSSTNPLKQRH